MQKLQTIIRSIGIKTMEAGLFFMAMMPGRVLAQLQEGVDTAEPDGVARSLQGQGGVFETVANILLFILGAVAVIMLIIGGFRFVISAGDSTSVESARNTILYAIIGIVVAFLAYAAVQFVVSQLSTGGVTS